jgi:hypothetical protein
VSNIQFYDQATRTKGWVCIPTHPGLQVPSALAPLTQAGAALAKGDAGVLHAPQLRGSSLMLVSQPSLTKPLQSLYLSAGAADNSGTGGCGDMYLDQQQPVMCCHQVELQYCWSSCKEVS